jgi:hypothetical protein
MTHVSFCTALGSLISPRQFHNIRSVLPLPFSAFLAPLHRLLVVVSAI